MYQNIRETTLRMLRLSTEAWIGTTLPHAEELVQTSTTVTLGAGDVLIRPGEPHPYLYYVIQGAMRTQSLVHKRLVTSGIRLEGEWVADVSGLGIPFVRRAVTMDVYPRARSLTGADAGLSRALYTAIEPTVLLRFDGAHLGALIDTDIEWERVFTSYLILHTLTTQRDFAIARAGTPAERYQALVEARPELVRRITQREIAGLLGLSEAGLSRVVKRVHRTTTLV